MGADQSSSIAAAAEQLRGATSVADLLSRTAESFAGVLDAPACTISRVIGDLLRSPAHLADLGRGAAEHASRFSWDATASGLLAVYRDAMSEHRARFAAAAAFAGVA